MSRARTVISIAAVLAASAAAVAHGAVVPRPRPRPLPAANAAYTSIDYPGASLTAALGVSRYGPRLQYVAVVGVFTDQLGTHGFLLSSGHSTRLDYPGAGDTYAFAINGANQVVGTYVEGDDICPFVYSAGVYKTQNLRGNHCARGSDAPGGDYQTFGVDAAGTVVGVYRSPTAFEGFVQTAGRAFTSFSQAELYGISNDSRLVGLFLDAGGNAHGMAFSAPTATGVRFDVPGAADTLPRGINDAGTIAGTYGASNYPGYDDTSLDPGEHGFLDAGGSFSRLDYPHAVTTYANGINDPAPAITVGPGSGAGYDVVGAYEDASGGIHGFIAAITPPSAGNA